MRLPMRSRWLKRRRVALSIAVTALVGTTLTVDAAVAQEAEGGGQQAMMRQLIEAAPYDGYLEAHGDVQNPPALLGGPLNIRIAQETGGVFVALPAQRELDPNVFGTPDMPRAFAGTPAINGLPPMARETEGGQYTRARPMTPFGDKSTTMRGARLEVDLTDATAMDAAASDDQVSFRAQWEDADGNTYEVRCCRMLATKGVEYPTFGGVVTNHLLHGSTRIGTALMPTEYVYAAFWGMGEVRKNGEVLQSPRLVHGMLTEYVRTEGYALATDAEVTPTRKHFHLMVPPFMPNPQGGRFEQNPVQTGFTLPNGQPLPFWHVMFENVTVAAERGG